MSEFFSGITFPQQKVTPSDDAAVRRAVLADGFLSGCELSYAGSTLTMGPGLLIECGREFRHNSVQNWAVTDATSGYARLVLTIDTSRASTKDAFNQVVDSIEYASSLDGFLQLQQDDINESGTIYQMEVCVVSLGAGGITGIVTTVGSAGSADRYRIGSWYLTSDPESPASFFGGTWEMITDRFLVGAGGSYANGETGGSATVKLTTAQMPKHTHELKMASYSNTGAASTQQLAIGLPSGTVYSNDNPVVSAGSGSAHENRPPYYALYMWRRVA